MIEQQSSSTDIYGINDAADSRSTRPSQFVLVRDGPAIGTSGGADFDHTSLQAMKSILALIHHRQRRSMFQESVDTLC